MTFADAPELLELYQDAMIILFQNLQAGKIDHLDNGPLPYLFGIAKNLIRSRHLKNWRELPVDPADEIFLKNLNLQYELDESPASELNAIYKNALAEMNENCLKIIEWFYYRDYPIEVIREKLGHASDEVTRVTKMRCLKKLREIIESKA